MALSWLPQQNSPMSALLKDLPDSLIRNMMERKKLSQQEKQHQEEMELRRQQLAKSGANSDLQRMLLQQQLLSAQHANDPNYEFNQFQALQDKIMGGSQGGQQMPQEPQPTQPMGEGMGIFSPEGMQEAQQPPPQQMGSNAGGINLDALKQNPMLRGFFKHKFGYDPLAMPQTPEEKLQDQVRLAREKQRIKKEGSSGEAATQSVLSNNQLSLQALDNVIPEVQSLIDNPDKIYGMMDLDQNKKHAYNAKTGSMIDRLIVAQQLPKVQESIHLVKEQIRRGTAEGIEPYRARLRELVTLLEGQRQDKRNVLKSGKINIAGAPDYSHMSDEELHRIAGGS